MKLVDLSSFFSCPWQHLPCAKTGRHHLKGHYVQNLQFETHHFFFYSNDFYEQLLKITTSSLQVWLLKVMFALM